MLAPEIRLLNFASAAPRASFCGRAIYDGVFVEDLVVGRHDEAAGTNDAEVRDADGVMDACARRDSVEVAYAGRVNT